MKEQVVEVFQVFQTGYFSHSQMVAREVLIPLVKAHGVADKQKGKVMKDLPR